jgi:hypothetical protein
MSSIPSVVTSPDESGVVAIVIVSVGGWMDCEPPQYPPTQCSSPPHCASFVHGRPEV